MKLALGLVVVLLGTSVASAQYRNPYVQSDWDPYWDHTRHLRNISWSLQDLNWTIYQQNLPQQQPTPDGPAERLRTLWETNPQLYTRMSLSQQAASSTHHSVMRRQQYKKDRRARNRAKMRDEALDREMRERGIEVID
jgi:hypothetical protein